MTIHSFRKSITDGSAATIIAGLLGMACIASAAADNKKAAAPAPHAAPAARPAAAPRPAGGAGGARPGPTNTGTHGMTGGTHSATTTTHTTTTTTHTTTTTGSHGNMGGDHSNMGGEHGNMGGAHGNTMGGEHGSTMGGAHPGGGGFAGAHGGGAGADHGAFNHPAPRGANEHITRSGSAVRTRPGGRVSDVHDARRGMDVHRGLGGGRRVSMERADHSRVFAERGRRGYVERGYGYHGHDFARRSYYYHGRAYDRFYRGYGYRGVYLNVYAPGYYYAPAFYGWAYNPWAAPIAFGWGWAGNPWFGFYGGYFQPYAVYPSAAFWLTDYIISQDLQAAYAARTAEAQTGAPGMPASLNVCEHGSCGTLTWDGAHYSGTFDNGAVSVLSVVRWDSGGIVLARRDPAGVSAGNTATYTGRITGPNSAGGSVTGVYNGGTWNETWNATSPTPILAADNSGSPSSPAATGGQPVLTPEVKQMIADEVKAQLALENQEATQNAQNQDVDPGSSGIARLLSDGRPHVFVAGGNLDVTDASGQECAVSDGDTLQLREPPPSDATSANLVVLSSKGKPECQISLTVSVQLTDLQEMQNHMRETIDQGLQDLQSKQGTGGLPEAPPSAKAKPTTAQYAAVAPPPEANVGADISQVDQQGDQSEKEVTAEVAQDNGGQASATAGAPPAPVAPAAPPAQPASVELGQTTDQVKASLGAPTRIANLGPKVIYYYSGMKVTFKDGKVSDVQ